MPFKANPLEPRTAKAIERALGGDTSHAAADAVVLAGEVQRRYEADVKFAEMFGQGGHDLDVSDPENTDGSCAHGYLCAYCNAELDAGHLAAAVTHFLATDPDTSVGLVAIFEIDGAELERKIKHVIEDGIKQSPAPIGEDA